MKDLVTTLDGLIRHRTDLRHGDEPALARHLHGLLEALSPDELLSATVPRAAPAQTGAYVYARWGQPRLLLNVHLDTVPPNLGWTGDPFVPRIADGKITGLGASDTKGAIAAILSAAREVPPANIAILFSGDEESGDRCLAEFLRSPQVHGLTHAIVCEPTRCRVGTRHRGVLALEISVEGTGGHSSRADTMRAPLGELARLATRLQEWGQRHLSRGPAGFQGMCLNIAKFEGGVAFNVVPAHATLSVSARCPPDADPHAVRAELEALCRKEISDARVVALIDNPPFHTRDAAAFEPWLGAVVQTPIDLGFWTEAALFSGAGIDAVVFGPGDIAQAHAPDECVEINQLELAQRTFAALLRGLKSRPDQTERHGSR